MNVYIRYYTSCCSVYFPLRHRSSTIEVCFPKHKIIKIDPLSKLKVRALSVIKRRLVFDILVFKQDMIIFNL